jgi:hypothetical protein
MKKIAKRLSFDRQTIRNLLNAELIGAQGGRPPLTRSGCATECVPGTTGGNTTGPATGGNICLQTELTCFYC